MGAYGITGYPFSPPFAGGCHDKARRDAFIELLIEGAIAPD